MRPEPESEHVKCTVTDWLVQVPAVYGLLSAVVALALIAGAVLSIWTGPKLALALLPALSVAEPLVVAVTPSLL